MRLFTAHFVRFSVVPLMVSIALAMSFAQESQPASSLSNAQAQAPKLAPHVTKNTAANLMEATTNGIVRIDSVPYFRGIYKAQGVDANGVPNKSWHYTVVGNPPYLGGTTVINAPVIPVSLDLLDYDGSVKYHYDVAPFVSLALSSPVFQNAEYTSSSLPTQFVDAVQRAEFFYSAKPDWHTLLKPSLKRARTLRIPRGFYTFALNDDQNCCRYVLVDINEFGDLLFPSSAHDTTTPIGAAEADGDITPQQIATFLFPNTFLYLNGNLQECCVLGYHTYDAEPGDAGDNHAEKRYLLNFSSWVSPGLFSQFQDITVLSHELSETFNDPFVDNATPWWKSPNGRCQDNLEVGDAIEGMNMATYPMPMNGMTYHPQNETMLQWFEWQSPSSALGGAYSYPNQNTLTQLSLTQGKSCR